MTKNHDFKVLTPSLQLLAISTAFAVLNVASPVRSQTLETAPEDQALSRPQTSAVTLRPGNPPPDQVRIAAPAPLRLAQDTVPETDQTETDQDQTDPDIELIPPEPTPRTPFPEDPTTVPDSKFPELEPEAPVPTPVEPPAGEPGTVPTDEAVPVPPVPTPEGEVEAAPETEVLVSEVVVEGVEGDLQQRVYRAISTRPGRTTTRSQLQQDINAVFNTGFFADVRASPSDTPLGVRVTFFVEPNPVLRDVQLQGAQVISPERVDQIFRPQYGRILNFKDLQGGIRELTRYYQDQGYVLAQVVGAPQVSPDGVVTLQVAEGAIEDINVRFLNDEGEPTEGNTREFIITRELRLEPGDVLNRDILQRDLRRVFGLGLFEDVQVALEPGEDPRQVDLVLNLQERKTGSFNFGAGFSSASGLFGTASYQQQNFGGNNQKLGVDISVGTRELLFDASFTDPWIAGTDRLSYTVNAFNRLTRPFVFDNGPIEVDLPNGDDPRVNRLGGGVTFTKPLSPFSDPVSRGWTVSAGLQYQRVSVRDADLDISPVDELGNPLSFSGSGQDDLFLLQLAAIQDLRNDPLAPTSGSYLRLSMDQSAPIGSGSIFLNRLRASYSYYIPVDITSFTDGPETIALNIQGGNAFGDLPPYEAFSLGGTTSVRGYEEGGLAAARRFIQATAEYRFPIFNIISGALFVDAATSFGSQEEVFGQPGVVRDKPGSGFGYGLGVRVTTPLGPVRVDYGFNNEGDSRLHFGIGERF